MIDLNKIATQLDKGNILRLTYRAELGLRTDRILDVAEDRGLFYVEQNGVPIWVKLEEAVEIVAE